MYMFVISFRFDIQYRHTVKAMLFYQKKSQICMIYFVIYYSLKHL